MSNTVAPQRAPSIVGGAMIIAGTAIGAGMLANPTAMSGVWFLGSIAILIYTWFCMYVSGLMLLEANLHYPVGASFHTIVKDLLGPAWNIITGLSVAFVLYILTYAYIFVGGGLTQESVNALLSVAGQPSLSVAREWGSVLFLVVLATSVWLSTKVVDRFSTILLGGMLISFFWSTGSMLGSAKPEVLFDASSIQSDNFWLYAWSALPVCLASFGYHGNVPSLVSYYKKDAKKVARSLLVGTFLALAMYLLWQVAVQGNLPRAAFAPVIAEGGDVTVLLKALSRYIATEHISQVLNAFAYMAIASSFLGVTLGLFDYIRDLFKFSDDASGRLKAAAVTFLPPLLACLLFPTGFVKVIGYAGLMAAIWAALVPALLVRASRKRFSEANYRVFGGQWMIGFILLFAVLVFSAQILMQLEWLPVFTGE